MKLKLLVVLLMLVFSVALAVAQSDEVIGGDSLAVDSISSVPLPAPPTAVTAEDNPNDHGHACVVHWETSVDDGDGQNSVTVYEVFRWTPFLFDGLADKRRELTAVQGARVSSRDGPGALRLLVDALETGRPDWYSSLSQDESNLIHGLCADINALAVLYGQTPESLFTPEAVETIVGSLVLQYKDLRSQLPDGPLESDSAAQEQVREILYAELSGAYDAVVEELRSATKPLSRATMAELETLLDGMPAAHAAYPNEGEWQQVGQSPSANAPGIVLTKDNIGPKEHDAEGFIPNDCDFYYCVDAVTSDSQVRSRSEIFGPVQATGQIFNAGRIPVLVAVLIFGVITMLMVARARSGAELYVRPIGGIEAVDEAIGRATEMGRPILYVLGLGTAADVATIASFTILGRVAKRVAEYQTELIVPTYDPIVMSVAQEVVKSAYLDAGRPDAYNEDIVFFVTQSQFAYVAAVNGIMLRQRPATNVYMGMFHAESLLLAETGVEAGSIQIAGTDQIAQLPFFIVACDYTLIGEELYAASAYLGREPVLLGSLKAQDYAKAIILACAIIGLVCANLEWTWFPELFYVAD